MNSHLHGLTVRALRILFLASFVILLPVLIGHAQDDSGGSAQSKDETSPYASAVFRTQVRLQHPKDLERVESLSVNVLEASEDYAIVAVDDQQLAGLARLGFRPTETILLKQLIARAGGRALTGDELRLAASAIALDSDGDGLTDTEEGWWCTDAFDSNSDSPLDPTDTNPSDGDEVQAILDGVTAYGPPFQLWPQFSPYNVNGNCPDGDFDGVPDYAEEFIIGTSQLRESSDKDKFDDGQELFGVTFCPASSGSCGYGILPRAEDSEFVSANLPAWVLPPGNSPWVAAFPDPEVEVVPSSLRMTAVTTITTEKTITEGEEHTYGTSTTKGTSTSVSRTETWNRWQSVLRPTSSSVRVFEPSPRVALPWTMIGHATLHYLHFDLFPCNEDRPTEARVRRSVFDPCPPVPIVRSGLGLRASQQFASNRITSVTVLDIPDLDNTQEQSRYVCTDESGSNLSCSTVTDGVRLASDQEATQFASQLVSSQDFTPAVEDAHIVRNADNTASVQTAVASSLALPSLPRQSAGSGRSRGGSLTTTTTQYEEQTILSSSANQFSESWSEATAVNTGHAANLRFTYSIVNRGTDYARQLSSLTFNIYIGDEPNPVHTYVAVGPGGQLTSVENLFPAETLTYTSEPIPLTLSELRMVDEGWPVRIVMEDISFGQDQVFYEDARNGSIEIAVEDGYRDGDEVIDSFLVPVWSPMDTLQDVLKRYFPVEEDNNGELIAISTPEINANRTVFQEHRLSLSNWWNVYLSESLEFTGSFQTTIAQPGTVMIIRLQSDSDLDGYGDRNEAITGYDVNNPFEHPRPQLVVGYTTECNSDDCATLLTLVNFGDYEATGVQAFMYSSDGLTQITNGVIGGSGVVPAGAHIVLGTSISDPTVSNWNGAQPLATGYYMGGVDRSYTITAQTNGTIGQSLPLLFDWSDGIGGSGVVDFGSSYQSPLGKAIAEGVMLGFQSGTVVAGESFTFEARTPRDTMQYTVNDPGAADPVIVVSYNDAQGNHRFVLPAEDFPNGSKLSDLNTDLSPLSGKMLEGVGLDIVTTGTNTADFVLSSPHGTPITNANLAIEYIDSTGQIVHEDVSQYNLDPGSTRVPLNVDLNTYDPAETVLLAYFTDSQGNIIDTAVRPLNTFQIDPVPQVQLAPGSYDFGSVEAGAIVEFSVALANTGNDLLRYVFTSLPLEMQATPASAGLLLPGEMRITTFRLDTAGIAAGAFSQTIDLRSSDPAVPSASIDVSGTIAPEPISSTTYTVSPYQPWNQQAVIRGSYAPGGTITLEHSVADEAARMHPLYLYAADKSKLHGLGEFGQDFANEFVFDNFGDGSDGDLFVSAGETVYLDAIRTGVNLAASSGQLTVPVSDATGLSVGDMVMIHQTKGTNAGVWERVVIASIDSNVLTVDQPLEHSYVDGGDDQAQVIRVPQYRDCFVANGGELTANSWDGDTGGLAVLTCTNQFTLAGTVNVNGNDSKTSPNYGVGIGFSGGIGKFGGEGTAEEGEGTGTGGQGGSMSQGCNGQSNGGGGGHATPGARGDSWVCGSGGDGGGVYGTESLDVMVFGGGGGGSISYFHPGAINGGGAGGGIAFVSAPEIDFHPSAMITSVGGSGVDPAVTSVGDGGSGAGGAVLLKGNHLVVGTDSIEASGGPDTRGGRGGDGRIRLDYCDSVSGTTTRPVASAGRWCQLLQQLSGGSDADFQLTLPDSYESDSEKRYLVKLGQRSLTTTAGNQLFSIRLPNRNYTALSLGLIAEPVAGSAASLNACVDIGNDGECDWSPPQIAFTESSLLSTGDLAASDLAAALNAHISAQGSGDPDMLIPIRVNIDTDADLFLFDIAATPDDEVNLVPASLTLSPGGNLVEGSLATVETTVTNNGSRRSDPFLVVFYQGDPEDGGVPFDVAFVPDLNAGQTSGVLTATWDTTGTVGLTTVYAVVDFSNDISEVNESDNAQSTATTVLRKADLVPAALDIPAGRAGESVTVSAVISNTGQVAANGVTITLFEGDASSGTTSSTDIVDVPAEGIAVANWTWTPGSAGPQELSIAADSPDIVIEGNEQNNELSRIVNVGWDSLSVDVGGPSVDDPAYDAAAGYGWHKGGSIVSSCGSSPEQTYRQAGSTETLEYQFDYLQPSRHYHVNLTFATCSGDRWIDISVDGQQVTDTTARAVGPVHVTDQLQTASILLDPISYQDGSVVVSLSRASGFGGPIVNLIDVHEVRYCYHDSGPDEESWTAESNCGYDPGWYSDGFNGWGSSPAETIRYSESGQVKYLFTGLDPAKEYETTVTFYEEDLLSRTQDIFVDGTLLNTIEVDSTANTLRQTVPPGEYVDGEVSLTIMLTTPTGAPAIVSEVALEEITRRYPFTGGETPDTPTPTPSPTPDPGDPDVVVVLDDFSAVWNGEQVDVSWSTTTEINHSAFELYRSRDGLAWAQIRTEPSQYPCGNVTGTSPTPYSYADNSVVQSTAYYYRLHFSGSGCGGGVMAASQLAIAQLTAAQDLQLNSGWNMISSYIDPQFPAMEAIFPPGATDLVLCKDGLGRVYWPEFSVNQIGNWNLLDGYQCYMNTGETPIVSGLQAVPEHTPVVLDQGWSLVAYLRHSPMAIEQALNSISGQVLLVKDNAGRVYWPDFGINQIVNMLPGQGYQVYLSAQGTLVYPAND